MRGGMMIIAAGQFKAECLKLMDKVNQTHEEIIISKRGKPIAKLVPVESEPVRSIFGFMKNTVHKEKDIIGSTGEEWDAEN
jgi:prevent-host-death family protein